jgi:class III poly(R)-hydroxyalkanoic acid synthase PhaE subunit
MSDPWTEAQQALLRQASEGGTETIRRIRQFGDDYLGMTQELWKFVESRAAGVAGGQAPAPGNGLDRLRESLKDKFARAYLPAFAPLQGQPQGGERLMAATLRWQRATARMGELQAAVAADAAGKLATELSGPDAAGPAVTTLRALHDLWVDCGERAYAAVAHGDDYAAAQAELLMAMVEMLSEQRRAIEEWARAFNLPTRSEIDAIHRRLHELSRVVREAQQR